jgi:hypothetical protein
MGSAFSGRKKPSYTGSGVRMTLLEQVIHQLPVLVPIATRVTMRLTTTFVDCRWHGVVHNALHKLHAHEHDKPSWINHKITHELLLVIAMAIFGWTLDAGIEHLLPEPEKVEAVITTDRK